MTDNPFAHIEINVPAAAPWPPFEAWLRENHLEAIWNLDVTLTPTGPLLRGSVHSEAVKATILEQLRAIAPGCRDQLMVEGVFQSAADPFDHII